MTQEALNDIGQLFDIDHSAVAKHLSGELDKKAACAFFTQAADGCMYRNSLEDQGCR